LLGTWNYLVAYWYYVINYQSVKYRNRIGYLFIPLFLLLQINLCISVTYSQNQEMVFIEAGNFNMGYNYDATGTWWYPTEIPVHTIYISAFYLPMSVLHVLSYHKFLDLPYN